jgi:ribosomal protein S18 acetylase RimI-like enzyme
MDQKFDATHIAAKSELDQAADDLAAAFVEDPIFDWFMREGDGRLAARRRFFRVILNEAAFPDGQIERPAGGGGAAVWLPSENLGPQPFHREIRALPMLLNAAGFGRFGRLMKLREAMDAKHPMEQPHDYLWFLGVHPEAQGRGAAAFWRLPRRATCRSISAMGSRSSPTIALRRTAP